jgi:hypothetical protein
VLFLIVPPVSDQPVVIFHAIWHICWHSYHGLYCKCAGFIDISVKPIVFPARSSQAIDCYQGPLWNVLYDIERGTVRLVTASEGLIFTTSFHRTYLSWSIVICSLTAALILGGEAVLYDTNVPVG